MFYELHTRSAFSFLSSGSQPQSLVGRAADLGINGVALLDRDTVAGAVRFHFEARERGIEPIIGAEITMDDGSLLPLVPVNLRGYQNLAKLITTVKLRHKKGEHFATREDIEEHSGSLLCFTGGADGFMHKSIIGGRGQADLAWLNYVFEKRLYVELQRHHLRSEEFINQSLLGLAHKLRIPYFAAGGAYYADQGDRELFDVFTCIKNHCTIYDAGRLLSENSERYLKTGKQMRDLFADLPEAVDITRDIAARVTFSMDELAYSFPDYKVPPGETMDSVLKAKAEQRAIERYHESKKTIRFQIRSRLDKELAVIKMKKLAGYFLLVSDISDFCREQKILSQGRGSAANSVVCYALGITAVDPIEHQLLFERFLSEKYEQYPDIDIDLPSGDDRERVIQHVYKQYGPRGAGMTANVISYRGKSAVREVGKTFGFGPDVLDRLSRLNSHYETFKGEELNRRLLEEGFNQSENTALRKFADLYNRILDFPRHLGQHSGGMVISLDRLDGIVPLEPASMENRTIIQWDKDDCEALKIVKIDLLGLGMMAVLRDSITLIGEHHKQDLSLYKIPNDDKKVYEALQTGDTVGMFQVESRAQIAFLPKSKPANFYDIVVQVAIIRPGPIVGNMLHSYINRRQGTEQVTYPHESLEPILKRTMGVPLFQEQLLKIAMDIAGFTGSEAEELRRAMGFKRPDRKMEKISQNLRNGMAKQGIPADVQEKIVDYTKAFANYGFPESHAYSFALLAYASAYFMVHYRACFMAAMLNNYPLGFYNAATLVKDAQRHGLHFIALDINRSDYLFTVEQVGKEKHVRVGLKFVRGLRQEVAEAIVTERDRPARRCCSICGEARLTKESAFSPTAVSSPALPDGGMAEGSSVSPTAVSLSALPDGGMAAGSPVSPTAVSSSALPDGGMAEGSSISPTAVSLSALPDGGMAAGSSVSPTAVSLSALPDGGMAAGSSVSPTAVSLSALPGGGMAEGSPVSPTAVSLSALPGGGMAGDLSHLPDKICICIDRTPYTSIEDLVRRVPLINKREIRALSLAGALNFEGAVHRREALWQSELAIRPAGELFDDAGSGIATEPLLAASEKHSFSANRAAQPPDPNTAPDRQKPDRIAQPPDPDENAGSGTSFLKRMDGLELIEADLKKTGISIGKHPMAFIREELKLRGILSALQTFSLKKGQMVSVGGAVIIRQRPMTAKNVVFITLEDETGHSNFVVMPDIFEKYRAVINQNDYLVIRGIFEERGMLKAMHFEPIHSFTAEVVSHNFR